MWCLSRQLQHCSGKLQMYTLYLHIHFHLVDTCVYCGRSGTSGSPLSLQHDYFHRNSEWANILCQRCLHQQIYRSPELLHPSYTLSLHSMAQPGLWSGDLFLSWYGHLPEDVVAVCLPTLHLATVAIIVASYYSSTAMKVFGRNNIAILATLFLLSYSKLLKTIITALSVTQVLVGSAEDVSSPLVPNKVWTYDGNIA